MSDLSAGCHDRKNALLTMGQTVRGCQGLMVEEVAYAQRTAADPDNLMFIQR